jgi:hypothetical protein
LRYYIYADQPFVRVRVQLTNSGTFGFGAYRLGKGPYPQHVILRSLSALIPTVGAGNSTVQVLTASDAQQQARAESDGRNAQRGQRRDGL